MGLNVRLEYIQPHSGLLPLLIFPPIASEAIQIQPLRGG